MRALLWLNHVLITAFAVSSGVFKLLGGQADLDLFAKLGLSAAAVAVFGALQATAGAGLLFGRTTRPSAIVVALCNAFATLGLFVAGIQPFGVISLLFVAMALLELRLDNTGRFAVPRTVPRLVHGEYRRSLAPLDPRR